MSGGIYRDVLFEFQQEVYYKVDRLLTGLAAQPKGTTAQWYSNKTSLLFMTLKTAIKLIVSALLTFIV